MDSTVRGVVKLRTHLVVLFGGRSAEHHVSCSTAWHVCAAIDRNQHDVTLVGISREGEWNVIEDPFSDPETALPDDGVLSPQGARTTPFEVVSQLRSTTTDPIVVVPLLHGPLGEDGTIQGLLEILDVAYVGSGVLGSAAAMDKSVAKTLVAAAGIPIPKHLTFRFSDHIQIEDISATVAEEFGYPCFVKPANMGSSVGVSRVDDDNGLAAAVDTAFSYDSTILIEEGILGREIEVAILGNEDAVTFPPGEVIPADRFYSYSDKYLDGKSSSAIPAELPATDAEEIKRLAVAAFHALGCSGLARCDFFYEQPGRGILFNEINTMPGFTPISMYPKMVTESGMSYAELINQLVDLALQRHANRVRNTGS